MNWRQWTYTKLTSATALPVIAAGALNGPIENLPAVVYRLQARTPRIKDGDLVLADDVVAEVWVYDRVGSYDKIDSTLEILKVALVGPIDEPGAVCCRWTGDSPEFADDELKAITRNATFQLIGASS